MEDTITSVYPLIRAGVFAFVVVLAVILFAMQRRPRKLAPGALWLNALASVAAWGAFYLVGGVALSWLAAAAFAIAGIGLGFVAGRTSKVIEGAGGKRALKRSMWPPLVTALSYVIAAGAVAWGTGTLFSAALLIVLLGAGMQVGATAAESRLATPAVSGQVEPRAQDAAPAPE